MLAPSKDWPGIQLEIGDVRILEGCYPQLYSLCGGFLLHLDS